MLDFTLGDLLVQLHLAAVEELQTSGGLTSCYVFSAGDAGVNCGATSPFTHQSEVKHSPPPRLTEDFVLLRHSMFVMGDDYWGPGRRGLPVLAASSSGTGSGKYGLSVIAKCYLPVMRRAR